MKQFIKNLWLFFFYLITQPFIELWKLVKTSADRGSEYSYIGSWKLPLLVLIIVFYLVKNYVMTNLMVILLILVILKTEWDERKWMERYREVLRKRAEKRLAK